jgi:hypothetical protein
MVGGSGQRCCSHYRCGAQLPRPTITTAKMPLRPEVKAGSAIEAGDSPVSIAGMVAPADMPDDKAGLAIKTRQTAKLRTPSVTIVGPVAARPGARAESRPVVLMVGQAARPGRAVVTVLAPAVRADAVLVEIGAMPSVAADIAILMVRQARLTRAVLADTVVRLRAVLAAVVLTGEPVWPVTSIMDTLVTAKPAINTLATDIPSTATLATMDITAMATPSLPATAVDVDITAT